MPIWRMAGANNANGPGLIRGIGVLGSLTGVNFFYGI